MALAQDNAAYRQGLADQKTGRRLTATQFASTHPGADGDDYPLYQAGRAADRTDLRLVPAGDIMGSRTAGRVGRRTARREGERTALQAHVTSAGR